MDKLRAELAARRWTSCGRSSPPRRPRSRRRHPHPLSRLPRLSRLSRLSRLTSSTVEGMILAEQKRGNFLVLPEKGKGGARAARGGAERPGAAPEATPEAWPGAGGA